MWRGFILAYSPTSQFIPQEHGSKNPKNLGGRNEAEARDEWYHPQWAGHSYINHWSRKCPRDLPPGKSGEKIFLIEVFSSQTTLACISLTGNQRRMLSPTLYTIYFSSCKFAPSRVSSWSWRPETNMGLFAHTQTIILAHHTLSYTPSSGINLSFHS